MARLDRSRSPGARYDTAASETCLHCRWPRTRPSLDRLEPQQPRRRPGRSGGPGQCPRPVPARRGHPRSTPGSRPPADVPISTDDMAAHKGDAAVAAGRRTQPGDWTPPDPLIALSASTCRDGRKGGAPIRCANWIDSRSCVRTWMRRSQAMKPQGQLPRRDTPTGRCRDGESMPPMTTCRHLDRRGRERGFPLDRTEQAS